VAEGEAEPMTGHDDTPWKPWLRRKPTVDEVVALAKEYYALDGNGVGGSLHIVLDDGNLGRSHVTWCEGYACGARDRPGAVLAGALLRLSKKERKAVYDRYGEYYR
jgi:hypothetical protein